MNCEWIKNAIGYRCLPLRGIRGEDALEIGTPFTFPDGSSINFYLLEQGASHVLISDNGDAAMRISSYGSIWNQRTVEQIEKIANENHVHLGEQGDLRLLVKKAEVSYGVATFITALIALSMWIKERLALPAQAASLADEAEHYLAHWKPNLPLEKNVNIKGLSKRQYSFDFQQGDELIDVISGNAQAVGATMRKAGDVMNSPFLGDRQIRIIVDDRKDEARAKEEKQILGSMLKAMLFSDLVRASGIQPSLGNLELLH